MGKNKLLHIKRESWKRAAAGQAVHNRGIRIQRNHTVHENTETNENESFHGKYLIIFDNTRSTEPVTVNYRMAVIPVEQIAQPERGGLLGGITGTIKRILG